MPDRARWAAVVVVALAFLLGACSTPETGRDDLATGTVRVQELLDEALEQLDLPAAAEYVVPDAPGEQTCRKTFLGYAVGSTGARRAELPVVIAVPEAPGTRTYLDRVERAWNDLGYDVSRPRTADGRYPKVQAIVGDGYRVVTTAFTDRPQVTVYAVSPCLRPS